MANDERPERRLDGIRSVRRWEALSPAYRGRLERAGISQQLYESGESLQRARGHLGTPERPARAERNARAYPKYIRARVKPMRVATEEGVRIVTIPAVEQRSKVGTYDNAVKNMLAGNDPFRPYGKRKGANLSDFTGVTIQGFVGESDELQTLRLLTDERELNARYYTGELRYEQIYAQTS
jgi:hypothetical protein